MLKVEKVLYATDFSRCSRQSLPHAVFLAQEFGAELHVFHALVPHWEILDVSDLAAPTAADVISRLEEHADEELEDLLAGADLEGLTVRRVVRRDSHVAPMVLDYAREADADLVVLGTHGRRGPGRLLLGSVAEEVVRLARCPVMTIKELEEPRPVAEAESIVVPIDFSEHSQEALRYARELAQLYAARLQLLHVVEQVMLPSFYIPGAPGVFPLEFEEVAGTAEEQLEGLMASPGPAVPFEVHVVSGSPAVAITDFAAGHDSDLIVLATHGLTGLDRLLAGSTAEGVTRLARCPVFTVKPFGKRLLVGD